MVFFQGARGRLHYRTWLADSAGPVAAVEFLPGSGQHSGHYHRLGRALSGRGIHVWCLDTSGQGLSEGDPAEPGTLTELVADAATLARLIRAECPGIPFFPAGHSLGAATCLAAADLPDLEGAGMILIGTPKSALAAAPRIPSELPVLALHGVDDRRAPIDPVREWAGRNGSVGLHEYPDSGHDLLHEPVHAAVTIDIARWIHTVAGRTAEVG
ncbi:MAG: alpha/beta hydrolase [Nocardia sp.]|nr:alpha/beta hydrolase [Nocardia sp.]